MIEKHDDYEIEDILENKDKKKKINCGVKGKSSEREIVHILNKRFGLLLSEHPEWGMFSRTLGSGNRYYQVKLSDNAKDILMGDLSCPVAFKYTIENKCGYSDVDLSSVFDGGNKTIDSFMEQVQKDSQTSGKIPLLLWKKDRKPRLAFMLSEYLAGYNFEYSMKYKNWTAVNFDEILKFPDSFFFNLKCS